VVATTFALLAVAACSDGPTKGGSNGTPAAIAISSGDNQVGMPGSPLAAPIAVRVTNAQGNPVAGKPVDFTVTRGAGTVASATVTNSIPAGAGIASVIYTRGEYLDLQQPSGPVLSFVTSGPTNVQARQLYMRLGYVARQIGSGHDVVLTHTSDSFLGARTFNNLLDRVSVVGAVVHIR
jgi:hypothetical protein